MYTTMFTILTSSNIQSVYDILTCVSQFLENSTRALSQSADTETLRKADGHYSSPELPHIQIRPFRSIKLCDGQKQAEAPEGEPHSTGPSCLIAGCWLPSVWFLRSKRWTSYKMGKRRHGVDSRKLFVDTRSLREGGWLGEECDPPPP